MKRTLLLLTLLLGITFITKAQNIECKVLQTQISRDMEKWIKLDQNAYEKFLITPSDIQMRVNQETYILSMEYVTKKYDYTEGYPSITYSFTIADSYISLVLIELDKIRGYEPFLGFFTMKGYFSIAPEEEHYFRLVFHPSQVL